MNFGNIARTYSVSYGLQGVPALIFNNKYLVSGVQPYEVLKQVVEKVLSVQWSVTRNQ